MTASLQSAKYPILEDIEIPANQLQNWQITANLLADIANIPSALLMRVHASEIEVLVSSHSQDNVYHPGERTPLNTGLYCETVMSTQQALVVPNALKDPNWDHNPDISLGMISYCGLPLTWPSGELFGTLCVLDHQENAYSQRIRDLMERFRDSIQLSLESIYQASLSKNQLDQTRLALRDSESRSQHYLETTQTIMLALDAQGCISMINRAGQELLGYGEAELIGRNWFATCLPQPEGFSQTYPVFQQIMAGNLAAHAEHENEVLSHCGKRRLIGWRNTCLKDNEGKIVGTLSSGEDITERKRVEIELEQYRHHLEELVETRTRQLEQSNAKLTRSEQQFRGITENGPFGVVVTDANKRNLYINPRFVQMFGYTIDDIPNSDAWWPQAYPDPVQRNELRLRWEKAIDEAIQSHMPMQPVEAIVTCKDGRQLPVECRMAPMDDISVVLFIDISARLAASQALQEAKLAAEQANQAKSEFLANMSHEIRTPMNAIIGMLYLALKQETPPTLHNYLSKAQGAARSLLGIINDILDFSKIEAGKLQMEQLEFGLDSVLEQLTNTISLEAAQKGIEFLIRYDSHIPPILIGDPLRLGQILLNLCNNAIKFTDAGEIELSLHKLSNGGDEVRLQISVRDTGIGMNEELQAKLFQKFTQADQSTTRLFGGTGLGLAISKLLVELQGGKIWLEESQPGKGSTFCFTVCLKTPAESLAHQHQLLEQVGPLLKDIRILVVDDNDAAREIFSEMLKYFRVDVCVAVDGEKALELLHKEKERPFDVVLMDWRMPKMNGDDVIRLIHADPTLRQPKIIMVTAYGNIEVINSADRVGVDGFLSKPVSPSTLLDTILSVLGRSRIPELLGGNSLQNKGKDNFPGKQVLLVEDNDINREFACELLHSLGICVDVATDGSQALGKVQQHDYDLVLMDIQMPVMDGLEAAKRIRKLAELPGREKYANLPIIAMTALAMAQDARKSQQAGMNDHITKPVDPERLINVLSKWLPPGEHETPEVRAHRNPESEIPSDLQAMQSIDASSGIHRIGGNPDAYRKQLVRFRQHYGAVDQLDQLISEQGLTAGEAYLHTLKGVSGSLGAHQLFYCVAELDEVLKQRKSPTQNQLQRLHDLLHEIMMEIDQLAANQQPLKSASGHLEQNELQAKLSALATLMESDLGAAEQLMEELRVGADSEELQSSLNEIAALLDAFEIDEALAQTVRLCQQLNTPRV